MEGDLLCLVANYGLEYAAAKAAGIKLDITSGKASVNACDVPSPFSRVLTSCSKEPGVGTSHPRSLLVRTLILHHAWDSLICIHSTAKIGPISNIGYVFKVGTCLQLSPVGASQMLPRHNRSQTWFLFSGRHSRHRVLQIEPSFGSVLTQQHPNPSAALDTC